MDKAEFFDKLYCLNDSSGEDEVDTNEAKLFLQKAERPVSSSIPSSFDVSTQISSFLKRNTANTTKDAPAALQRTTSAPLPDVSSQATVRLNRKPSLLCYDVSIESVVEASSSEQVELVGDTHDKRPTQERRTVSTPTIGSVVMTNSTGIATMLNKNKRKRSEPTGTKKKTSVKKLVPERDRIFRDQTFYFIPPDDIAPARKGRIHKAESLGAVWAKEWTPTITHVIVDKTLTYNDVKSFFKLRHEMDELPLGISLVNEVYTIDCAQHRCLLDPDQRIYNVSGFGKVESTIQPTIEPEHSLHSLEKSLEVKSKRLRKSGNDAEFGTPSQDLIPINTGVPFMQEEERGAVVVDSPQETTLFIPQQSDKESDALDDMLAAALRLKDLPLDDDDDDEDRPSSDDGPQDSGGSGSEGERAREVASKKKRRMPARKRSFIQENFTCMQGGNDDASDGAQLNARAIELLQELADYYDRIRDQWRSKAYRTAIGTLKRQSRKITTYDEAFSLNTIGHRLATKIEEICVTDRLSRLEFTKLDSSDRVLQDFLKVYGVGVSQAMRWIQAGHRSLEDLSNKASLSPNQQLGVEHYDDFNTRIPRDEVTALGEIVKKAAHALDPEVEIVIGGSYRRGASYSGDIDCLVTKKRTTSSRQILGFLLSLVDNLTSSGFLVAALAEPRHDGGSKWHGACILPGTTTPIWRRIDFLLVPHTELGAALIYFTGDDIFNRSIRLLSSKKGYRLNQRGLYKDVMRGPGRVKLNEGSLVEGSDEKRIFEILGVPWRAPEKRICH